MTLRSLTLPTTTATAVSSATAVHQPPTHLLRHALCLPAQRALALQVHVVAQAQDRGVLRRDQCSTATGVVVCSVHSDTRCVRGCVCVCARVRASVLCFSRSCIGDSHGQQLESLISQQWSASRKLVCHSTASVSVPKPCPPALPPARTTIPATRLASRGTATGLLTLVCTCGVRTHR